MADTNISMIRGDTLSFGVEFEDLDQNLSSAYFTVRGSLSSLSYLFQKSLSNGISKVTTGQYIVRVAPEDTENLDVGLYYYDFEVSVNGDVFTILKGILEIEPDVTRR